MKECGRTRYRTTGPLTLALPSALAVRLDFCMLMYSVCRLIRWIPRSLARSTLVWIFLSIGLENPIEHMETYATRMGGGEEEGEGFC